jgi:cytochrome c oxidase subunit 1
MAESAIPIPQTGERRRIDAIWDWVTTVDHKKIGIMYIFTAVVFFIVGGIDALLIRTQLVLPENSFLSAQTYNEMFTSTVPR